MAKEAIVKNLTLQLYSQSTELENFRQQLVKCRSNIYTAADRIVDQCHTGCP